MALSPAVVYTTSVVVEALGYDGVTGRGTVDSVTSIISLDFTTYAALFSTTGLRRGGVCCVMRRAARRGLWVGGGRTGARRSGQQGVAPF